MYLDLKTSLHYLFSIYLDLFTSGNCDFTFAQHFLPTGVEKKCIILQYHDLIKTTIEVKRDYNRGNLWECLRTCMTMHTSLLYIMHLSVVYVQ